MKRYVFTVELLAEDVEHALLTLAEDALTTVAEHNSESGQIGEVLRIEVKRADD